MLTLTSHHKTALHALPAGPKLAALALITAGMLALPTAASVWALAVLVALVHLALGRGFARQAARALLPLWPFLLILLIWHFWTDAPERGALVAGRMLTAVALANLVTMTTRLDAMIALVERITQPVARWLPPRRLALAIALVIRFTPVLMDKAVILGQAWRARSARRRNPRLVLPLVLAAIDDAEQVAEAIRARGGV
ncbi:energy-coupling factor transporter transmembrane component T [Szabonella alba]|uniref:Energy-coupling factor transporter transmembrane protein EcfT n=1 Tax=Szabonella alba TaxID=2804194 RepID=A0A8K0Y129_9RHOB|nr:energy-coupling factor transporter transmembrane component T [Szabonella alba]MBL4917733.1 energy-coupling factor transporter transmembrane protein EcfT [Szabonella alba]